MNFVKATESRGEKVLYIFSKGRIHEAVYDWVDGIIHIVHVEDGQIHSDNANCHKHGRD